MNKQLMENRAYTPDESARYRILVEEDLGHEVMEAGSGAEALELLAQQRFDLVITDQSMPRMSGTQLMDAIVKNWPDTKMILATGYSELPGGIEVKVPRLNKPFAEHGLKKVLAAL